MKFILKNRYLLILIILFILSVFISHSLIHSNKTKKVKLSLEQHSNALELHYKLLLHTQYQESLAIKELTFLNKNILNIFEKANNTTDILILEKIKNKLENILHDYYIIFKKEGVLQYHFILANSKTFLRMHKPSKFNDDLSNERKDIFWVNKNKKEINGFYDGKTSYAFRNIFPIYSKTNKYLGALDISFPSIVLQNNMAMNKLHTNFIVHKSIPSVKIHKQTGHKNKFIQSNEHDNFMLEKTIHFDQKDYNKHKTNILEYKNLIKKNIALGKKFVFAFKENNT